VTKNRKLKDLKYFRKTQIGRYLHVVMV